MDIIGLSGAAGAGKNTVGDTIALLRPEVRLLAFADPLKRAAFTLNPLVGGGRRLRDVVIAVGWDRAKAEYPETRRVLQVLGTDVCREQFGDTFWIDRAREAVEATTSLGRVPVFTDVRFPNELDFIHELGGKCWRIERPGLEIGQHSSEQALIGAAFDVVITNDSGIHDLIPKVEAALGE